MESDQSFSLHKTPFCIVLADDDIDDHFFFEEVLDKIGLTKGLRIFDDGEKLLAYLSHEKVMPDVVFLDYNLPRKNGEEYLVQIKKHPVLKDLPVVMYSTYLNEDVADRLYALGAHFFVRKTDLQTLHKMMHNLISFFCTTAYRRPERSEFIVTA